jgi:glycosyltransferase involved in cell wall biosynthesis
MPQPLLSTVTAVIPTRNRPELVCRAVRSVIAQTHYASGNMDCVVVIDGPDEATVRALEQFAGSRLKVLALDTPVGGSQARNLGAQQASGAWVALLDDDDEWLPEKIARQLEQAAACPCPIPIVCTAVLARSSAGDMKWPLYAPSEPYSDYLLVRNRLSYGEGLMQTSTLMAPKALFEQQPFTVGLVKHQDWDWILRCLVLPGTAVVYVPEALAIWYVENGSARLSRANRWRESLAWIEGMGDIVTPLAHSSFIATYVAQQASDGAVYSAFFPLLARMFKQRIPRPRDLAMFLGAWFFPISLRDRVRRIVHSRSRAV